MRTACKMFRNVAIVGTLLLGTPSFAQEAEQQHYHQHLTPATSELIEQLQMGGHVLLIRHERTNAFILDREDYQIENCAAQRNLSIAGSANAVENGEVIRFLDIPIGEVIASPMCRTLETARLMFGDVTPNTALHGAGEEPEDVRTNLEQLIVSSVGKPDNTVLVTHLGIFTFVYGGHLAEGDAAIFDVEDGAARYLGTIPANAWNDAVIDASIREKHHNQE